MDDDEGPSFVEEPDDLHEAGGGVSSSAFDEMPEDTLLATPAKSSSSSAAVNVAMSREPAASTCGNGLHVASACVVTDDEQDLCETPDAHVRRPVLESATGGTREVETPRKEECPSELKPGKRRRLRSKRPAAELLFSASPSSSAGAGLPTLDDEDCGAWDGPSFAVWLKWTRKQRQAWLYEKVRLRWTKTVQLDKLTQQNIKSSYRECRAAWQSLDRKQRWVAFSEWLDEVKPPAYIVQFGEELFPQVHQKKLNLQGRTALLTYIGPWGVKDGNGELKDLGNVTLDGLLDHLRHDDATVDLWNRMRRHVDHLVKVCLADDWAVCMEVCTKSFALSRVCRLHFHVFLRSQRRMFLQDSQQAFFEGSRPNLAAIVGGIFVNKNQATWNGAFYCTAEKVGSVFTAASKAPFKDYLVAGQWVMNLVQSEKLSLVTARKYILSTCHNVHRFLQDLDRVHDEQMKTLILKAKQEATIVLRKAQRPFIQLRPVLEWQRQFDQLLWRYRYLVLEGPTRMGKTAFAMNLCPSGLDVLEINCASGDEPDLRGYRYGLHGLLLFDEISPAQVARQRKLFQGSNAEVQLGCSSTNIYSYCVYVHAVRMVLCSNNWSDMIKKLPAGDAEWVINNSIHVMVDRPLFKEE